MDIITDNLHVDTCVYPDIATVCLIIDLYLFTELCESLPLSGSISM